MPVFNTPIVEIIDGQPVDFPKLAMEDYEALFVRFRAFKKLQIEKTVKEGLITADQGRQLQLALADSPENIFDIQNSFSHPKLMLEMIGKSWKRSGRSDEDKAAILAKCDPEQLANIAFRISHREMSKVEDIATTPKDEPEKSSA